MILIRLVLAIALIYGVYTETGIWTAISLVLIYIFLELVNEFNSWFWEYKLKKLP